jgi:signal transduction histidine kinase
MGTDNPRYGSSQEQLRALVTAYEAKLTEVADLVAHVRHEINNPLTGVLGQAQLLLREDLNDKARQRVETLNMLAGRIRDTVAQLRDVQRPHFQGDEQEINSPSSPPRVERV